jgi:hypothetical protein
MNKQNTPTVKTTKVRKVRITRFFAANDDLVAVSPALVAPGSPRKRYGERAIDIESVAAGATAVGALCLLCLVFVSALTTGWLA